MQRTSPESAVFESLSTDFTKSFKLIPSGQWYRGDRVLDITEARLNEVARNFAAGLPRYRVPINLDHEDTSGKVGTVKAVAVRLDDDGKPALYVTEFELTNKGRKAVDESGYDSLSAEVYWSLNGATYQDPKTGVEFDNVLVGVALTPRPFFGHGEVALYSADRYYSEDQERDDDKEEYFGEYSPEYRKQLAEEGRALPDGSYPIETKADLANAVQAYGRAGAKAPVKRHILKRAKELDAEDLIPAEWSGKEEAGMTGKTPEQLAVEQSAAEKAAAEKAAAEQLAAEKAAAEQLAAEKSFVEKTLTEQLTAERARTAVLEIRVEQMAAGIRTSELKRVAEAFVALPVNPDEFATKFQALERVDKTLAEWFTGQFAAFDKVLTEAGLLNELGNGRNGDQTPAEQFIGLVNATLKEKFAGNPAKYSEALAVTSKAHPDLAKAYTL